MNLIQNPVTLYMVEKAAAHLLQLYSSSKTPPTICASLRRRAERTSVRSGF